MTFNLWKVKTNCTVVQNIEFTEKQEMVLFLISSFDTEQNNCESSYVLQT